jgi:hypothetical protein
MTLVPIAAIDVGNIRWLRHPDFTDRVSQWSSGRCLGNERKSDHYRSVVGCSPLPADQPPSGFGVSKFPPITTIDTMGRPSLA